MSVYPNQPSDRARAGAGIGEAPGPFSSAASHLPPALKITSRVSYVIDPFPFGLVLGLLVFPRFLLRLYICCSISCATPRYLRRSPIPHSPYEYDSRCSRAGCFFCHGRGLRTPCCAPNNANSKPKGSSSSCGSSFMEYPGFGLATRRRRCQRSFCWRADMSADYDH